jgi:uncharacterized metal-binding protein YceD (DUF177 family)
MSDSIQTYRIPHIGLKKEVHEFSYELTEAFFANFDNALIQKCNIQVNISFDNRQEPYTAEIDLDGIVWSDCDRCTASIPVTIHATFVVYIKYTSNETEIDTDEMEIIYVSREEQYIDLSQFLYDFVHLSIPVHVICDNPGKTEYCDMEIIGLLEEQQKEEDTIDPRWGDLDKLKDKLN